MGDRCEDDGRGKMPFRGGEALDEVMGAHRDAVVTDEGTQVSQASVGRGRLSDRGECWFVGYAGAG